MTLPLAADWLRRWWPYYSLLIGQGGAAPDQEVVLYFGNTSVATLFLLQLGPKQSA